MKKCKYCTADMNDNETKCSYCGKDENEKQELKEINNNEQTIYIPEKKNSVIYILLIITVILSIAACFLPYIKVGDFTINCVYNENIASLSDNNGIKDGIFVVILGVISLLTLLIGKKRIPTVVCQFLSIGVFFIDYIDAKNNPVTSVITDYYAIGFYLVIILLIFSLVLSITRLIGKDKLT